MSGTARSFSVWDSPDLGVPVGRHVLPQVAPRHEDAVVVGEVLHQNAKRHGTVVGHFFDEVFDLVKNIIEGTWPTWTSERSLWSLHHVVPVAADSRFRRSHHLGDVPVGDDRPVQSPQQQGDLDLPG